MLPLPFRKNQKLDLKHSVLAGVCTVTTEIPWQKNGKPTAEGVFILNGNYMAQKNEKKVLTNNLVNDIISKLSQK